MEPTSIEKLAENGETLEDEPVSSPPIDGTRKQLSLDVGGEKVTSSEFKLTGGSVPLEGEFKKGDLVVLRVECRIGKLEFEDTVDPSGTVTKTVRRHVGKLEGVTRAD